MLCVISGLRRMSLLVKSIDNASEETLRVEHRMLRSVFDDPD